jgi:hypothetical protein
MQRGRRYNLYCSLMSCSRECHSRVTLETWTRSLDLQLFEEQCWHFHSSLDVCRLHCVISTREIEIDCFHFFLQCNPQTFWKVVSLWMHFQLVSSSTFFIQVTFTLPCKCNRDERVRCTEKTYKWNISWGYLIDRFLSWHPLVSAFREKDWKKILFSFLLILEESLDTIEYVSNVFILFVVSSITVEFKLLYFSNSQLNCLVCSLSHEICFVPLNHHIIVSRSVSLLLLSSISLLSFWVHL